MTSNTKTEAGASDDLEQMTPNQRRALNKALSALETMAALWASEIRLTDLSQRIADVPNVAERAKRIAAFVEQGFIEGAYRHYLDHKDQIEALAPVAPAVDAEPVAWALQEQLDKRESTWRGYLWFVDPKNTAWTPLYASAQSEGGGKDALDAPAQVAGAVFRAGVPCDTVIKAAQRNYQYRNDPAVQDYPDRFTLAQIQAMDSIVPQGDREFVTMTDYSAMAKAADRYQWLREHWGYLSETYDGGTERMVSIEVLDESSIEDGWPVDPASLDEAIDLAIAASPKSPDQA